MPRRKLPDWLSALRTYVEDTEAPREFWLWGGIFTICSAMQRKTWLSYGIENIYPNIYIMLVGPPACRKAGPCVLSKKMLLDLDLTVSADSSSKRALTKELAEVSKGSYFDFKGKSRAQCPMAIISKELSSLLAVDPKGMIEVLTDLFDSHDKWQHKTSGEGQDFLYGVCLSCFVATTPTWLEANLPQEAIGGGYTSRHIIVSDTGRYKSVPIPAEPSPLLYRDLLHDLGIISGLVGEFKWGEGAKEYFSWWYENELTKKTKEIKDQRLHGFIARMHAHVLKTSMALHVSKSDKLIIEKDDLGRAIESMNSVLGVMSRALGGYGRSRTSIDVESILDQIYKAKDITFTKLLQLNYHNTGKEELEKVLDTVVGLKYVKHNFDEKGEGHYKWKGG